MFPPIIIVVCKVGYNSRNRGRNNQNRHDDFEYLTFYNLFKYFQSGLYKPSNLYVLELWGKSKLGEITSSKKILANLSPDSEGNMEYNEKYLVKKRSRVKKKKIAIISLSKITFR